MATAGAVAHPQMHRRTGGTRLRVLHNHGKFKVDSRPFTNTNTRWTFWGRQLDKDHTAGAECVYHVHSRSGILVRHSNLLRVAEPRAPRIHGSAFAASFLLGAGAVLNGKFASCENGNRDELCPTLVVERSQIVL